MLLRTMLPWFNAGEQPDYEREDGEGGGGDGGDPPPAAQQ